MTPLLLFVDIETNGLNPITDEIIEIAGILCSYEDSGIKIISTFDQTVANIQPIDPIVTKITGLTDQLLASSQKAFIVRDNWANWLETELDNNQELIIIGHSLIEFDAKFLKAQGWFLPESARFLDTFYLSKILLPQLSAVNLESLTVNLKLNPQVLMTSGNIASEKIVPHRALYDTACCLDLWLKLVDFVRMYDILPESKKLLIDNFVGVRVYDLGESSQKASSSGLSESLDQDYQSVNWLGKTLESSVAKQINKMETGELKDNLANLARIQLDISNQKSLQIYLQLTIMLQARLQYNWQVHIHGQKSDHSYLFHLWNSLQNNDKIPKILSQNLQTPLLENLIWQVDEIANRTVNMLEMVNLINIVQDFGDVPEVSLAVTKLFNSYDFWLISLNQFWIKSQYIYNPGSMPINQENIYHKFETMQENMEETNLQIQRYLGSYTESEINVNAGLLAYKWLNTWLEKNKIDYNENARLFQVRDTIKIAYKKTDFNLIRSFEVLLKMDKLFIPTYLTTKQAESLVNLYQLDPIRDSILSRIKYLYRASKVQDENIVVVYNTPISWIDGYADQLEDEYLEYENNHRVGRPRLWLANTNSTLTKIASTLEKTAKDRNSYNIVGLTGSITKITSKIKTGFDGIAVIKQSDIYMLKNLVGINWDSITIIGNSQSFISPIFDYINLPTNQNKKLELTQLQNSSLKNQIIVVVGRV